MKKAPLQNEFRWSVSRQACYEECQKKYWYTYYGAWEGWPVNGFDPKRKVDPLAALLYRLKQIQTLPLYVGSVVHQTIESALKMHHKNVPPLETLQEDAKKRFWKGIEEAKEQKWRQHPKKFANLFEWYYEKELQREAPTKEILDQLADKISQMIAAWRSSPALSQLILAPQSKWAGIEQNIDFVIEERIPVIVVLDFMLYWPTSKGDILVIFDWKTGAERKENIEQLYAYALGVNARYGQPIDRVVISPFYLSQGATGYKKIGYKQSESLDPQIASHVAQSILTGGEKLLSIHKKPVIDPIDFAYTDNRAKCSSCPFVEICQKAKYEDLSKEQLKLLIAEN